MQEPKTLKDLKTYYPAIRYGSECMEEETVGSTDWINKFNLMNLIIAHIKYMRREGRDYYYSNIDEKSAIPKLMEIFNLNEEDVK